MGKLVLTSGGYLDGQRGKECDEIIEKLCENKNVLLIDNATLTGSNVNGISNILNNFLKISKNIKQLSLKKNNLFTINEFDTIYITGGDIAPLLQLTQECELSKEFLTYLKKGGNIIGESAGSIIFGKDIKFLYDIKKGTKPKYDIELSSYKGLSIVDKNIFPHWNKTSEDIQHKVLNYEKENNIKITKLRDGEFIVFDF